MNYVVNKCHVFYLSTSKYNLEFVVEFLELVEGRLVLRDHVTSVPLATRELEEVLTGVHGGVHAAHQLGRCRDYNNSCHNRTTENLLKNRIIRSQKFNN